MRKRVLDLALTLPVLVLATPLLLLFAIWVRLDSPGPAFFRQRRVGRYGKVFTLLKLRTMRTDTPELPTDQLVKSGLDPYTRAGRFLRRTSLDELPQLINVVRGEMSLVGPRPALETQRSLNEKRAAADVDRLLPGITGWAQINGRDALTEDEKVAFDIEYLQKISVRFDLKILFCTFVAVGTGQGNK